jgi:hypothetical protein
MANIQDNISDCDSGDNENKLLDISWLHHCEKLLNIQQVIPRKPSKRIQTASLYILNDNTFEFVLGNPIPVCYNSITGEQILQHTISNKRKNFNIESILLYHVNIHPELVRKYSQSDNNNPNAFTSIFNTNPNKPCFNPIPIPPSVAIFHPIHLLTFVYTFVTKKREHSATKKILFSKHNKTHKIKIHVPQPTIS